jgi:hypothetical protein
MEDDGSPPKTTVDGTDFETVEYMPFNPGRHSHKFNGPDLRYKVVLAVKTGWIIFINGPFIAGSWLDIRISRSKLQGRKKFTRLQDVNNITSVRCDGR